MTGLDIGLSRFIIISWRRIGIPTESRSLADLGASGQKVLFRCVQTGKSTSLASLHSRNLFRKGLCLASSPGTGFVVQQSHNKAFTALPMLYPIRICDVETCRNYWKDIRENFLHTYSLPIADQKYVKSSHSGRGAQPTRQDHSKDMLEPIHSVTLFRWNFGQGRLRVRRTETGNLLSDVNRALAQCHPALGMRPCLG